MEISFRVISDKDCHKERDGIGGTMGPDMKDSL